MQDILQRSMRHRENYQETREDLEDLFHNEPAARAKTQEKLEYVDNRIKEVERRIWRLHHYIENGCDVCYPDIGVPGE